MDENFNQECAVTGKMPIKNEQEVYDVTTPLVGIYGLQNKLKPDKWYIGQSLDIYNRWKNAYLKLKCKAQPKIYNVIRKYGYDAFNKIVLEECPKDKLILLDRENYWIFQKNSIENGYNLIKGRCSSGERTLTVKEKIGKAQLGIKKSSIREETQRRN
jgi:group I intron endonuclease